jgi:hypothetical protein
MVVLPRHLFQAAFVQTPQSNSNYSARILPICLQLFP